MTVVSAVEWVSANQMFSAQRRTAGARGSFIFDSLMATSIVTSDCPTSVYKAFLAAESRGKYFSQYNRNRFQNDLVYRNANGGPRESLEQQLSSSVQLAKARAAQKCDAAHAAGVQE